MSTRACHRCSGVKSIQVECSPQGPEHPVHDHLALGGTGGAEDQLGGGDRRAGRDLPRAGADDVVEAQHRVHPRTVVVHVGRQGRLAAVVEVRVVLVDLHVDRPGVGGRWCRPAAAGSGRCANSAQSAGIALSGGSGGAGGSAPKLKVRVVGQPLLDVDVVLELAVGVGLEVVDCVGLVPVVRREGLDGDLRSGRIDRDEPHQAVAAVGAVLVVRQHLVDRAVGRRCGSPGRTRCACGR